MKQKAHLARCSLHAYVHEHTIIQNTQLKESHVYSVILHNKFSCNYTSACFVVTLRINMPFCIIKQGFFVYLSSLLELSA